jgi:hypothetical protein
MVALPPEPLNYNVILAVENPFLHILRFVNRQSDFKGDDYEKVEA